MLDEVAGRVRENMEGEGKSDVETRYKQVASQPRVRQWTNDATRAAWLARETPVCSPSVKQAPKLVWQEAPLRKPLCEDMRVQLGRASHARSRRRSTFNRDDTVASSLSNNRTRKLAYISDIRVFFFSFFVYGTLCFIERLWFLNLITNDIILWMLHRICTMAVQTKLPSIKRYYSFTQFNYTQLLLNLIIIVNIWKFSPDSFEITGVRSQIKRIAFECDESTIQLFLPRWMIEICSCLIEWN